MTWTEIITNRVRKVLHDATGASELWADTELFAWGNDAVRLLMDKGPAEAKVDSEGVEITFVEVSALTETFILSRDFAPAVCDYILYRAFDSDAEDKRDETRSDRHLARWQAVIEPE